MYLFYLDESGGPNSWNECDNFILAGAAIHEGQVRRLSKVLDGIQGRFFPGIEVPLELHAQHIHSGKGRFRRMSSATRLELLRSAYKAIRDARFPNLIAFVTSIHVSAVKSPAQALEDCLEDICMRFNTFLVGQHKAGFTDKGLLIMDSSGREARIREIMGEFKREGTRRGYLGNIVDVPYFADSRHTRMLQIADLLAFSAFRYLNKSDDMYMNIVRPRLARRNSGQPVGFKHIVSAGFRCPCMARH